MVAKLLQRSTPSNLAYVADIDNGLLHKMDHLVCFLGGVLALGAKTDPLGFDSPRAKRDLHLAEALTHTCVQMYFPRATHSVETSRRDAAAATWIFRGDELRRRRGRDR